MEATQLTVVDRVRTALSVPSVEAEFKALAEKSKSITVITNEAGYQECHAARMRLVKARTSTEKSGKQAREDATAFSKAVIAEEKRLIAIIETEEKRLQALQEVEDQKREAKIAAERERVEKIEGLITGIQDIPRFLVGQPAAKIAEAIEKLKGDPLSAWAMEFQARAHEIKGRALATLEQLHAGAVATEKAAADEKIRIEAERAELAKLREEQAKREAEAKELAEAEQRKQDEARAQIQREQIAAQNAREEADRIAQAARDKADSDARAIRDAEEARLKAQREEIEAKQREADEAARKRREELEATAAADRKAKEDAEREVRRLETELMDGATLLTAFKDRFGKRREFAGVVKAVDAYFEKAAERKAA